MSKAEEEWEEWENSEAGGAPEEAAVAEGNRNADDISLSAVVGDASRSIGGENHEEEKEAEEEQEWGWDLKAMEADLAQLQAEEQSKCEDLLAQMEWKENDRDVEPIAIQAVATQRKIRSSCVRMGALQALALVTKIHLLQLRKSFQQLESNDPTGINAINDEIMAISKTLTKETEEWGFEQHLRTQLTAIEEQEIRSMTRLLHDALSTCDEGNDCSVSPFQNVLEQLFASLPDQTVRIPVALIRGQPSDTTSANKEQTFQDDNSVNNAPIHESMYLKHLLELSDPTNDFKPISIVPVLTEAEKFQDAKDIKRDELRVNGHFLPGTIGYDAIVDHIQTQLYELLCEKIGKNAEQSIDNTLQATTRTIAMQILHASNRTESGGSSYEILGLFLSNHNMDHIIIRPDSARAAPLEIQMDVGAYLEPLHLQEHPQKLEVMSAMWAFGVRVTLAAVTWYLVCDAKDPTNEFYQVKTTYCNRLAFPLGLTPFHPLNHMRKDHGSVAIQLIVPTTPLSHAQNQELSGEDIPHRLEENEIDFDQLM